MENYRGEVATLACNEFDNRLDKMGRKGDYINQDHAFAIFTVEIYGDIIKRVIDEKMSPEDALKFDKKDLDELFDKCVECTME